MQNREGHTPHEAVVCAASEVKASCTSDIIHLHVTTSSDADRQAPECSMLMSGCAVGSKRRESVMHFRHHPPACAQAAMQADRQ
jgi:hypothetical protein